MCAAVIAVTVIEPRMEVVSRKVFSDQKRLAQSVRDILEFKLDHP